jgi:biotin carboxylase
MRTRARELGLRIPEFVGVIHHDDVRRFLADVPGPWLLKPRSQASSLGIQKLHHADEVWRAIERLGDDQSYYLLERLVPGELYHVESLVADGRVAFAEVHHYLQPLLDVHQTGGVYATRTVPRDRPEVAALRQANERVLTGFGLGCGAAHTEFMKAHADGELYFIETNARVGRSHTAEMVEAATGVNLWDEWARLEATPDVAYEPPPRAERYAGVVLAPVQEDGPDVAEFVDPEIVHRLDEKQLVGVVVGADAPGRVEELVTGYAERLGR